MSPSKTGVKPPDLKASKAKGEWRVLTSVIRGVDKYFYDNLEGLLEESYPRTHLLEKWFDDERELFKITLYSIEVVDSSCVMVSRWGTSNTVSTLNSYTGRVCSAKGV